MVNGVIRFDVRLLTTADAGGDRFLGRYDLAFHSLRSGIEAMLILWGLKGDLEDVITRLKTPKIADDLANVSQKKALAGVAPSNLLRRSELGNALSDLGTNPLGRNINRLEEFGTGAGFSGVYDVQSGKFLAYASGETKLANGAIPLNRVEQFGGHQSVNTALSEVLGETSANRLGFSMTLDAQGNFAVRFNSGINSANPNVLARTVPESMRQQILEAITKSTGRKAYSAQ